MSEPGQPSAPFAYDELIYPSPVVPAQTPDRIAAAALMHGFEPPDPTTASILEIGCGDGLNLIAIAAISPKTHCVGFDLSAPAIARGVELASAAGLTNVALHAGDILTWPRDGERFDYITAHGVYSWVPGFVREAILELVAARLAPGGVAYISFDAAPATLPKAVINRFLISRIGDTHDTAAQAEAALKLIHTLARNQKPGSGYTVALNQLIETKSLDQPGYVVHDILEPYYLPVSAKGFAEAAGRYGLDYVADASLLDLFTEDLDDEARAFIASAKSFVGRAHLLDMLRGDITFRRALITHAASPMPRSADPFARLRFGFFGERKEVDGELVFLGTGESRLHNASGGYLAVMSCFADHSPRELTLANIASFTAMPPAAVQDALRNLAVTGLIEAYGAPQPFTLTPGERPVVAPLIRLMFRRGDWAVNFRHLRIVAGDSTRAFAMLCDGTRTRPELARALSSLSGTEVPLERIDAAIRDLAWQAVFVA